MDARTYHNMVITALWGLLLLAVVSLFYLARDLILPVFVAVFLWLVLQPAVRRLCRLGMGRPLAAIVTMAVVVLVISAGAWRMAIPALEWLDRIPIIALKVETRFQELQQSIAAAQEASEQLEEITAGDAEETDEVVVADESFAEVVLGSLGAVLTQGGTTIGLLFFLLAFGEPTLARVVQAFEMRSTRRRLRSVSEEIEQRCAQYLRTITVINIGVGVVTGLAMWALDVPNPSLWGALAGCLNFMPYLGPLVMMTVLAAVGIVTFQEPVAMIGPVLAFGAITGVEGQFVTPAIVGRQLTLNPIAVFLAIVVWFWIWGVAGAIIAVPLLATAKIVADQLPALAPLAALLGRPAGEPPGSSDAEAGARTA